MIHVVTAYGDSSLAGQPYHVYDNIISNYYNNINHVAPYSLSGPYLHYGTSVDDIGKAFSSKVNLYYETNSDNSVCYVNIGFRVDNATEVNKLVVDIQPIFIPTNIITQYPLTYKTLVVFPEHTPGNATFSVHSLGYTLGYALHSMEAANSSVETKANAAQTKANSAYTLAQRKQDQLTAGDNITIVDNVISSTGGSGTGGADGYSPTVSITDITGGNRVTVTDVNGVHTFDVMNGADGADGAKGATGATGAQGATGATGAAGAKGDKGDAFTYADFTAEQLAALKGAKGDKGEAGAKGDAFTYSDFTAEQLAALTAGIHDYVEDYVGATLDNINGEDSDTIESLNKLNGEEI